MIEAGITIGIPNLPFANYPAKLHRTRKQIFFRGATIVKRRRGSKLLDGVGNARLLVCGGTISQRALTKQNQRGLSS